MLLLTDRLGLEDLFDVTQWGNLFSTVNLSQLILALLVALLVGLSLFFVYRKTFKGAIYSFHFNMSLVPLTLITSVIMLLVSSNLVLSLGALGALSIVRFRTPIKDTMDIVYVFFAIGEGIVIGTGLYGVVVVSTIVISATLVILSLWQGHKSSYLLIVRSTSDRDTEIRNIISKSTAVYKTQTVQSGMIELDVLFTSSIEAQDVFTKLNQLPTIGQVSLIQYEH